MANRLPTEIQDVFKKVHRNLFEASVRWQTFHTLYRTSDKRFELMNWAAATFFADLQYLLFDSVLLAISRLTDPPRIGPYRNASIPRLLDFLSSTVQGQLIPDLSQLLSELQHQVVDLRVHRDKRLAHLDDGPVKGAAAPLPKLVIGKMDKALQTSGTILNRIEAYFGETVTMFGEITIIDGADTLVGHLKAAAVFEEKRNDDVAEWWQMLQQGRFRDA